MKKWTKLIALSSVAVLTSASSLTAFANDSSATVPASTDVPAVVTVPSTGEITPTTPPVSDTTAPSVPSQPTQPTTETSVPATSNDNVKPTQPATNNDNAKPSQPTTSNPTDSTTTQPASTDTAAGSGVTVPTVDGGSAVLTPNISVPTNNPNVSAQTAADTGASQVGTTSQVTGQVVANVNSASPIQTNTGYQVISTKDSQVVVAYADGTTDTVSAEVVGGTVNADKTISLTNQSGEKATLPSTSLQLPYTGEKEEIMMSWAGAGLLAVVGAYFLKKKSAEIK
ncbi:LPXTG cell wall anchor domain-containing protein [Streptococcus sanguinis]|uniref:LPXTG cell wall anchor domain-containing protein n=1 Tax=Streptococcus sanguinis TaxID=1305 RepID=A0A5A7ZUP2_STRSA|nr:LPXTG cell wall anchor domain-containing protein [Streptococcus sanguinis]KAA0119570.1 LPXTG cell wall anchor domain-containing protein [Streptococcus sanguinis]